MLKSRLFGLALAGLVTLSATLGVAATSGVSLEGVKCLLVAKKDANPEKKSKWKDGDVYFCCDGCLGKFEKMTKKDKAEIAPAANHQLVATKQYKQGGCPFSGKELKKDATVEVNGVTVGFCCDHCQETAEKMDDKDKLAKLFSEKAFAQAKFSLIKSEK